MENRSSEFNFMTDPDTLQTITHAAGLGPSSSLREIRERMLNIHQLISGFHPPPYPGDYFLVVHDGAPDYWFLFSKDEFSVGRGDEADLILRCQEISRAHCTVKKIDGDWVLSDFGSKNGIKINSKMCHNRELSDGDLIQLAEYTLIFWENP